MPSSGIVAIDPANNDAAVIDASTLSAAPQEVSMELETANELSQEDEEQPALSPMPHKKAPMVTPRTDRKVTTSDSSSGNTASSRRTPVSSKGGSKKKVAVATPVAAEDSSSPKKSKKSSTANNVPMKTMKHFFGKVGAAKAKQDKHNSSSTNGRTTQNQKKEDDTQPPKKVDDKSSAEPSADSAGEEVLKAAAADENVATTKKGKAKTNAKPENPQQNSPQKKKAKATPKSFSVDNISIDNDSPMDALAIVSRNMSAGRRSRVTGRALPVQKKERDNNSVENKARVVSSKDTTIVPKDSPKTDEVVTEIEETSSSSTTDNDGEDSGVASEKVDVIRESDDDATVAMDDSDTSADVKSDNAAEVQKENSLSELPAAEVECTKEATGDEESDKGSCTVEKEEESIKDRPVVIVIDEPTPETETSTKEDTTNIAEAVPPKNKRDPNAPKKPKSALNLYQIAKRNEFKAANPDTKAGDIVSKVDNCLLMT
jgi:hypothetical protein